MSGRLFSRIGDLNTLYRAWSAVKANAGAAGADDVTLDEFERNLSRNLAGLSRSLLCQSYVPEPTRTVMIPKPDGTRRRLSIPAVKDRVAQQAARLVIEPLFEGRFLSCSFGYRPGLGPLRAVERVETLLRDGHTWAAGADIDSFFDSLNQPLLLRLLSERIWEQTVLRLIELWLRSGSVYLGNWQDNPEGVPQGGVISPLLANIYLHRFDAEMTRRGLTLVRYADDYLFLEPTREQAIRAARESARLLAGDLHLKTEQTPVAQAQDGFVFLGFLFRQGRRMIAPGKLETMRQKVAETIRAGRDLTAVVRRLNLTLNGWRRYYGSGDVKEQFRLFEMTAFRELGTRLKTMPGQPRSELTASLEKLEFLLPGSRAGKMKLINLLLANAAVKKPKPKPKPSPPKAARAVRTRRRQYERLAEEQSVLLVDRPGSFVGKVSGRAVVRERGRKALETPLSRLRNILISSNGVGISSDLVRVCAGQNVTISFQDERGHPCAYLVGAHQSAHPLANLQLAAREDGRGKTLARAFVQGKISNQLNLLRYYARYRGRTESEYRAGVPDARDKLKELLRQLAELAPDEKFGNRLFAIEGQSAAVYWGLVKKLLAADACFDRREKKGATDLVNSLLNYGYGVLYSLMYRFILLAGLNPTVGFIHHGRTDRPNLLFDMVEEFRQPLVDRAVFRLLRRKMRLGMDGLLLDHTTKHKLVSAMADNLGSPVYYNAGRPGLRVAMEGQVQKLVGFLKNGERYRPFIFH